MTLLNYKVRFPNNLYHLCLQAIFASQIWTFENKYAPQMLRMLHYSYINDL